VNAVKSFVDDESIALITIPAGAVDDGSDAINSLREQIAESAASESVKAIVIAFDGLSFGEKVHRPGLELDDGTTNSAALERLSTLGDVFRDVERSGKPVIAAVSGGALDEGLELMLSCHYRIVEDDPDAKFGFPCIVSGRLPVAGGTQRLPRVIGIAAALPVLVEGQLLDVKRCLQLGLVNLVAAKGELMATVRSVVHWGSAANLAPWDGKHFEFPAGAPASATIMDLFTMMNAKVLSETAGRRPALRSTLSSVFEGSRLPIDKALKLEQKFFIELARHSFDARR
jgi:3-hydroxyacyl-CoA dehydrogenase/enoyl-CoA hydratase/3-hydroxybutyryl-CoA epimerase